MHDSQSVNRASRAASAFTLQSSHYDLDDKDNLVIQDLRKQVYEHVARYMKPNSRILELNAGTGIDATYFVSQGHSVLATDLSDGMIEEMKKKNLSVLQLSYDKIDSIKEKFDYVFSNFGGLNCIDDLTKIKLTGLLKSGGFVTWVVMPRVSPWEILSVLKGNGTAFRRLKRGGVSAHIDGEHFQTWYHSLSDIKNALRDFDFIASEGLAALSPPPYKKHFPGYRFLRSVDRLVNKSFPFNRWADHIIVTFRKR